MPLKPTTNTSDFKLVEAGNHVARLISIIDLGTQDIEYMGEKKEMQKVRFTWELCNELEEFNGEKKTLVIGNDYTNSMGSKANLRKIIEGMIGAKLKDEEAANFDSDSFKEFLGKECLLNVIHNESKGKTYANIASVSPLAKGMTAPAQFNPSVFYEIGVSDQKVYDALPKFIKEKIMKSHEMNQTSGITEEESLALSMARNAHNDADEDEITADSIPF